MLAQSHMEILPPERAGIRANVVETVRPKGPVQGRDGQRPGAVRRLPLPAEAEKPTPFEGSGTAARDKACLLYTSPSPRDLSTSRMPSSA